MFYFYQIPNPFLRFTDCARLCPASFGVGAPFVRGIGDGLVAT